MFFRFTCKALLLGFVLFWQVVNAKELKIIYTAEMRDVTESQDGSYANLLTMLNESKKSGDVLFLFGGNSLGPSLISNMDKGAHIVDIMNSLEPDVYGVNNSDFSFSMDEFSLRADEAVFPFLLSNATYKSGKQIDGTVQTVIVKKAGIDIGVIATLKQGAKQEFAIEDIKINDVRKNIKQNAKTLRKKGAKIIVLLASEDNQPLDDLLDKKIVDLVFTKNINIKGKAVKIKSKNNIYLTKFDEVAFVKVKKQDAIFSFEKEIKFLKDFKEDAPLAKLIASYKKRVSDYLSQKIGVAKIEFNTLTAEARTKETLFGNLVTDAIKKYVKADIAFINSGVIRSDKIYKAGSQLKRADMVKALPFRNKIVLLEAKGETILKALENGLSMFEEEKGRFLQVSGLKVRYDTSLKVGHRVQEVFVGLKKLKKSKNYLLATTDYLHRGGDGFSMLKNLKSIKKSTMAHRLVSDVVTEYIIAKKSLDLKLEKRLINKTKKVE